MIERTEEQIMKNWSVKNTNSPIVSIRCLAYNHENYIERALNGFLIQETTFPFEIIIHDDASTDNTAKIIRKYEKKYPKIIKPIYEVENQYSKKDDSLRKIMNTHIHGKYVALCEGDDYWISNDKLEKQINFMEKHPEYTMSFHAANYVDNGKILSNDRKFKKECDISAKIIIEGGGDYCATASLCYKREYDFIFPKYRLMADIGDYPLQILLATSGKVHYFPEIMCNYEIGNHNSWTHKIQQYEKKVQHWKTEISWLKCFNELTEFKYRTSVNNRFVLYYIELYYLGAMDIQQVKNEINKEISKIEKNRMLIKFYKYRMKKWFKKYIPFLYKILASGYHVVKKIR